MTYDEENAKRSRVVVETPAGKREVYQTDTVPVPVRSGASAGVLIGVLIVVVALATIVIVVLLNRQQDMSQNQAAAPQSPQTVVQSPAPAQAPVIVQQPAPATAPAPVIINPPPSGATESQTGSAVPDDTTIQAAVDKRLSDEPSFTKLSIVASVVNRRVTLTGSVPNAALKSQVEKVVRNVRGVKSIDNQIIVESV